MQGASPLHKKTDVSSIIDTGDSAVNHSAYGHNPLTVALFLQTFNVTITGVDCILL